jgi:hypothetical protein
MGWNWNKLNQQYPSAKSITSAKTGMATLLGDFIIFLFKWVIIIAGICLATSGVGFLLGYGALCAYYMLVHMFGVVL